MFRCVSLVLTENCIDKKRNEGVTVDGEHHLTEPWAHAQSSLPVRGLFCNSDCLLFMMRLWAKRSQANQISWKHILNK